MEDFKRPTAIFGFAYAGKVEESNLGETIKSVIPNKLFIHKENKALILKEAIKWIVTVLVAGRDGEKLVVDEDLQSYLNDLPSEVDKLEQIYVDIYKTNGPI